MVDKVTIKDYLQALAGAGFAEMLVFAGVTIAPPDVTIGIIALSFNFILTLLSSYGLFSKATVLNALKHTFVGTIMSFLIAVIFAYLWAGVPLSTLFSMQFFTTPALVAMCVGMFSAGMIDARHR